jgi:hypothetical protein
VLKAGCDRSAADFRLSAVSCFSGAVAGDELDAQPDECRGWHQRDEGEERKEVARRT